MTGELPDLHGNDAQDWFDDIVEDLGLDPQTKRKTFVDCWSVYRDEQAHPQAWKNWVVSLIFDCSGPKVRNPAGLFCEKARRAAADGPGVDLTKAPKSKGINPRYVDVDDVLREHRESAKGAPVTCPPMAVAARAYREGLLRGGTIEAGLERAREVFAAWEAQGYPPAAEFVYPEPEEVPA